MEALFSAGLKHKWLTEPYNTLALLPAPLRYAATDTRHLILPSPTSRDLIAGPDIYLTRKQFFRYGNLRIHNSLTPYEIIPDSCGQTRDSLQSIRKVISLRDYSQKFLPHQRNIRSRDQVAILFI